MSWCDFFNNVFGSGCEKMCCSAVKDIPEVQDDVKREPLTHRGTATDKLEGTIVVYVNVGTMPPYSAEAYILRMMDRMGKDWVMPSWSVMWLPTRWGDTRVEYFKF